MNLLISLGAALLSLAAPGGVTVISDLSYQEGPRGRLDVYEPRNVAPGAPIAVFFYGGSWQSGDKRLYRFVGKLLASRGIVTIIPDYRTYPEVRYPEFLRDNARAVVFARSHAKLWGADPRRLYLIGHSAGAYDAAMLGVDPRWLGDVGLNPARDLAGVVGLAGPYDFLPLKDETLETIFGPPAGRPDTQPINHVNGRNPPLLLIAGTKDSVVDPGNATRLAVQVRDRGGAADAVMVEDKGHIGLLVSLAKPFGGRSPLLDRIADFVRAPRKTTSVKDAA